MKKYILDIIRFILFIVCILMLTGQLQAQGTERIMGNLTTDKQFTFGTVKTETYSQDLAANGVVSWVAGSACTDTISQDVDVTFSNVTSDQWISILVYSDGNFAINWAGAGVTWQGGTAPTQTQDKLDLYQFWKVGPKILGMHIANF